MNYQPFTQEYSDFIEVKNQGVLKGLPDNLKYYGQFC